MYDLTGKTAIQLLLFITIIDVVSLLHAGTSLGFVVGGMPIAASNAPNSKVVMIHLPETLRRYYNKIESVDFGRLVFPGFSLGPN